MLRPQPRSVLATAGRLAAATAGLAGLGGCGTPSSVPVPGRVVHVFQDEYRIRPAALNVHAGRLKFESTNTGILTHNLRIQSEGANKRNVQAIYGTSPVAHPGQTVVVKVTLPPGRYKLICGLGNHADLGERATLTVRR